MNVCVVGLWHLGTVTAACLASGGHQVTGLDFDPEVVHALRQGRAPIFEPGLDDLIRQGMADGRLVFKTDRAASLASAELVWLAYDTPVDDDDRADSEYVIERATSLFPHLPVGALVLVSSQLPVGSTRRLEQAYASACPDRPVSFGYSPENLRLGKAIAAFTQPDRVVVGLRSAADRERVQRLWQPFASHFEWMSVESAEMTKHALNAFLATSVAFINEVATLAEQVGADAKEVERGLKSERRIGPLAYLSPGGPFAGGTLARDLVFLAQLGAENRLPTLLLSAVQASNAEHMHWPRRKLITLLGDLNQRTIAVWGLTYKPGTDTLRRSSAVELCRWLAAQGARVHAHDPAVKALPADLAGSLTLCASPLMALDEAEALVVATEWPEYRAVAPADVLGRMTTPIVLDANRFLAAQLENVPRLSYFAVGKQVLR